MFIKNQFFKDEETLLEQLFDFGLGEPADIVQQLIAGIDKELEQNQAFREYKATLTDEEDILELDTEERMIRLAEKLMTQFDSFAVEKCKLYGIKGDERTLLYEIDLV